MYFVAPPGLSIIISPFLKIFSDIRPLVVGGVVVAILGFLAIPSSILLTNIITKDKKKALFCTVATALGGPLWIYSTHIFPQAPLTSIYTLFTYLAIKALRRGLKIYEYIFAGFLASLIILLNPAMAIAIIVSASIVLIRLISNVMKGIEKAHRVFMYILFFLLGISPLTILLLLYNTITTGDPFLFPEILWLERISVPNYGFTTPLPLGLYILLLDLRKGLIPLYPIFALTIIYIPRVLRAMETDYERIIYLSMLIIPIVIHAAWHDVGGGLSFGPRFIVPITMLLTPSIVYILKSNRRAIHIATLLLVSYGIIVNIFTATVTPYPSVLEDLKPWQNQFINSILPLLSRDIRSSYIYDTLRLLEFEEISTTATAIILNAILSITILAISYRYTLR